MLIRLDILLDVLPDEATVAGAEAAVVGAEAVARAKPLTQISCIRPLVYI